MQQIFLAFKLVTKRTNRTRKIVRLKPNAQESKLISWSIQHRIKYRQLDPFVAPNELQNPAHDLVTTLLLKRSGFNHNL